jgi:hypothetical protein
VTDRPGYQVVAGQNDILSDGRRVYRIPPGTYESEEAIKAAAVDIGPEPTSVDWVARGQARMAQARADLAASTRAVPVADPYETLALIAEHRLTVEPHPEPGYVGMDCWRARVGDRLPAIGATIGDAVRACVARIKE